ncbi:hypothetical protein NLU13_0071 [Sarocladium strictum]|uniref:Uncharacterized protein n=1 Tax=Sarocladium strictum TaxID=5046 RepID=A0AA39GR50_SARSR|nr:hypothetical protein NLU13_0071 [Sarocladium strictum]
MSINTQSSNPSKLLLSVLSLQPPALASREETLPSSIEQHSSAQLSTAQHRTLDSASAKRPFNFGLEQHTLLSAIMFFKLLPAAPALPAGQEASLPTSAALKARMRSLKSMQPLKKLFRSVLHPRESMKARKAAETAETVEDVNQGWSDAALQRFQASTRFMLQCTRTILENVEDEHIDYSDPKKAPPYWELLNPTGLAALAAFDQHVFDFNHQELREEHSKETPDAARIAQLLDELASHEIDVLRRTDPEAAQILRLTTVCHVAEHELQKAGALDCLKKLNAEDRAFDQASLDFKAASRARELIYLIREQYGEEIDRHFPPRYIPRK